MLYVSIGRTIPLDNGEFREFLDVSVNLINNNDEANMMSWDVIHKATREDGIMLKILDHNRRGMPDSGQELDNSIREYHRFCHDLHEVDGVLCYRDRIVIPTALRTKVRIGVHAAHQRISP